jgi:AcrR family transcriptional regulator
MTMRDPRANQKERTRAAIVEAATRLLRDGKAPTVADAAEAAKVSRATAYRYFPTPEALMLEVSGITPAYVHIEELVRGLTGGDVEDRLARFMRDMNGTTFADEAQMRMALKIYLDTWFAARGNGQDAPPVREGRRMRLLESVLDPVRRGMTKQQWQRLQSALALTVGVEPMVIMKDVCRLGDEEAQEVLLWVAKVLLKAGLADAGAPSARPKKPATRSKAAAD